ncbi:putative 2OG-Fe(II) oxygenase [Actimicrobium antarcticum]|uniref:2OG-Fe(II) oxygenase n=1 Tax=Actimicrobium antarcticum TaxID=1051899 RepID=A0ABP7T820_9BURK
MSTPLDLKSLWGIPLASARFARADNVNPELLRAFKAMRLLDPRPPGPHAASFYASNDDLLQRCQMPEMEALFGFIAGQLGETVSALNRQAWQDNGIGGARIVMAGSWFQMQNDGAFHDVHTHGNASWSGVYYLDIDPAELRAAHPVYGVRNGVLRFYGPWWDQLAGAHIDAGNAYLMDAHLDIVPEPGLLVLFPSHLKHQAFPYSGTRDRVVISFNARVEAKGGAAFRSYDFS